ncbi:MAG: hypothetical protein ABJH68_12320 [Ilumatobacter sp.]|uniref:hypothetical protein n=1 Tax=Ilumatobacter sp. TaxID=1967498 RepID=UPI00329956BE
MRTPTKLAAFGGGVTLVFAGSLGVGAATGSPIADSPMSPHGAEHGQHESTPTGEGTPSDSLPGGLVVADRGYALVLAETVLPAGSAVDLAFRLTTAGGDPVVDYEVSHEKEMHLILVRRDGTGFQHLHPTMTPDGTWSTSAELTPGAWQVFADFVPAGGENLTLGSDLSVPGVCDPEEIPEPAAMATVDGYEVTLDGELVPGRESELTLSVSRDGVAVDDLEPYLGAYGHLVALRAGDLAYLHVHPDGDSSDSTTPAGPDVTFYANAPSSGTYLLYLDFQHDGRVRTAQFTVATGVQHDATAPSSAPADHGSDDHSSDGHGDDGHGH